MGREESTDNFSRDYGRVEEALRYVAANYQNQPDLARIAASVSLSEAHFQRMFKRWVGVSPKQFLQYLTLDHARQCLSNDLSVLDAALDSGLTAPARLNELFVRLESITPVEFKQKGRGIDIDYGFHQSPFGKCLIGVTDRGLTGLEFCAAGDEDQTLQEMMSRLPSANYHSNRERSAEYCELIFGQRAAKEGNSSKNSLPLLVRGTPFQIKVWEALLRVPKGCRISYKKLATAVGSSGASRAVGTAVGKNPVAILIPCHRVIREDGMLGGYHWGIERKLALLGAESVTNPHGKETAVAKKPTMAITHEECVVL